MGVVAEIQLSLSAAGVVEEFSAGYPGVHGSKIAVLHPKQGSTERRRGVSASGEGLENQQKTIGGVGLTAEFHAKLDHVSGLKTCRGLHLDVGSLDPDDSAVGDPLVETQGNGTV